MSERSSNIITLSRTESRKLLALVLLFLNVTTSAAVSIYIPCMRQMVADLGTTNALIQMTIVAHLMGEFVGRVCLGPLVDFHNNRSIILTALSVSAFGHLGCMLAPSLIVLMIMRFIQALGASTIYIVSLSIINNKFSGQEKASIVGVLELYQPIAWLVSPLAGALLSELGNWRLSFGLLMLTHLLGVVFFWYYKESLKKHKSSGLSVCGLLKDYRSLMKNSLFVLYALVPGFFAGGYMIFMTNCPFICSKFLCNNSANIAMFSAIPLIFYIISTFAYGLTIKKCGTRTARRIGTGVYIVFGIYAAYLIFSQEHHWALSELQILMCLQCIGSAFLVPVSVFKALKTASNSASVGASTVVVFRNIIMSICISISAKFGGNISTISACVFMTVASILTLTAARKIIKVKRRRLEAIGRR